MNYNITNRQVDRQSRAWPAFRIPPLAGLLACLIFSLVPTGSVGQARAPVAAWRDAFQSSPADYDFVIPKGLELPPAARERLRDRPPVTGTLRVRFAIGVGGQRIRIRLSNEEGAQPLKVRAASLGIAAAGFEAKPGSVRRLPFGGRDFVTIPPGAPVLSDPIDLAVQALAELVVSLHIPGGLKLKPFGGALMAVAPGDQTAAARLAEADPIVGRPPVAAALVFGRDPPRIVVALGDSITDGNRTSLGELRGWPEQLQRRLLASAAGRRFAVVNAGIGGNRVMSTSWGKSVLARFDRDVGRIGAVSHLILLEGINDIAHGGKSLLLGDNPPLDPADLIDGYRQIIARAHAQGIKVVIGTLTPFEGGTAYNAEREGQRSAVNRWIRLSGEPDAIVDFDLALRDPRHPLRLLPGFDSGDHLHPNERGYRAMGDAIDLAIFK
jgi:lysophospholipase L1-like esterase